MAPAHPVRSSSDRIITIKVPKPQANQRVEVQSRPGARLEVDFNPESALLSRSGNNLVLSFEDGGSLVLTRFFAVGDRPFPYMVLPDGMVISTNELFADAEFDTSTAAAPAQPARPVTPRRAEGSGVGEYREDNGELLDSVETLSSLSDTMRGGFAGAPGGAFGRNGDPFGRFGASYAPGLNLTPDSSLDQGDSRPGSSGNNEQGPGTPGTNPDPGTPPVDPPAVTPRDLTDPDAPALNERGLASGSEPGFVVIAHSIVLPQGYTLDATGWTAKDGVFVLEQGNFLLSYSPSSNTLTYELIAPFAHPDAGYFGEELDVPTRLSFTLLGEDGSQLPAYVDVQVLDDAPQIEIAGSYCYLAGEEGAGLSGQMRLFFGADGPADKQAFVATCNGEDGEASADGNTFSFKDGSVLVMERDAEGAYTGKYTFTPAKKGSYDLSFTATDSDGDYMESVSVLVEVRGPGAVNLSDPQADPLEESGLPGGTQEGLAKVFHEVVLSEAYSLDTTGWAESPDGSYTTIKGGFELTWIESTNTLRYALVAPFDHPDSSASHEALSRPVEIGLNLIHENDGPVEAYLAVQVLDDAPQLTVPSDSGLLRGAEGAEISGSLDLVFGADGTSYSTPLTITCNGVTGVRQFDGLTYVFEGLGSLQMEWNPDGRYTGEYVFIASAKGEYDLVFQAHDADGDSSAPASVHVSVKEQGLLDFTDSAGPILHESGLPEGTEPGAIVGHSVSLGKDYTLDFSNWTAKEGGVYTTTQGKFSLTYDSASNTLSYELVSVFDHPAADVGGGDVAVSAEISFTVTNSKGEAFQGYVQVQVADDAPVISIAPEQEVFTCTEGGLVKGSFQLLFGADGKSSQDALTVTCNGKRGVLQSDGITLLFEDMGTLLLSYDAKGNYTGNYTFKPLHKGEYVLSFTAKDGDGDETTSKPVVINAAAKDALNIGGSEIVYLEESGLPGGTLEGAGLISQTLTMPEGYRLDTSGWTISGSECTRTYGNFLLTYDATTGTLTYKLVKAFSHSDPSKGDEVLSSPVRIPLKLIHESDGERDGYIDVQVHDDAPEIFVPSGYDYITGVLGSAAVGWVDLLYGGDGPSGTAPLGVRCGDIEGVLQKDGYTFEFQGIGSIRMKVDAEGNYTGEYEFMPVTDGQYSLVFTVTDADGDTAVSAPVSVRMRDESALSLSDDAPTFHESGLPGGTEAGEALTSWTTTIPGDYVLVTKDWNDEGGNIFSLTQGSFALRYNALTKELQYELVKPFKHPDKSGGGELLDKPVEILLSLEHPVDGMREAFITVDVYDDAPLLNIPKEYIDISGMAETAISGRIDLIYGADGAAEKNSLLIRCGNTLGWTRDNVTYTFAGVGTLTIDRESGTYTFKGDKPGVYNIIFTATDADGDSTSADVRLTVEDFVPQEALDLTDAAAGPLEEGALPGGNSPSGKTSHTVLLPEGYTIDLDKGWEESAPGSGLYLLEAAGGKIVLAYKDGAITYSLAGVFDHAAPSTPGDELENLKIDFGIMHPTQGARDAFIMIDVKDDSPLISTPDGYGTLIGNAGEDIAGEFHLYYGVDGPNSEMPMYILCNGVPGSYAGSDTFAFEGVGTLTLQKDALGQYNGKYVFKPLVEGSFELVFAGVDGDGDVAKTSVNVLVGDKSVVDLTPPNTAPLEESALPGGTAEGEGKTSGGALLPSGYTVDTTGWQEQPQGSGIFMQYQHDGKLLLIYDSSSPGSVAYRLTGRFDHPNPGEAHEALPGDLTLSLNLTHPVLGGREAVIKVNVLDDAPIITTPDGYGTLIGDAGEDIAGEFHLYYGVDGPNSEMPMYILCNGVPGSYVGSDTFAFEGVGTLTLQKDALGQYNGKYVFKPLVEGSFELVFAGVDGDGDVAKTSVNVLVGDKSVIDLTPPSTAPLEESALPGGTAEGEGKTSDGVLLPSGYTVDTTGWQEQPQGSGIFMQYQHDGKLLLIYDSSSPGSVAYRLTGRFDHPNPDEAHEALPGDLTLSLNLTHPVLGGREAVIKVNVLDDAPIITTPDGYGTLIGDAGEDIAGEFHLFYGVDGPNSEMPMYILCNGVPGSYAGSDTFAFEGVGTLTLQKDALGQYNGKYLFKPIAEGSFQLLFVGVDGDGDTARTPVNVLVGNKATVELIADVPLEESALPGGSAPGVGQTSGSVALPQGYGVDITGWQEQPAGSGVFVQAQEGGKILLVYDTANPGSLGYRLEGAFAHSDPQKAHESLDAPLTLSFTLQHPVLGGREACIRVDVLDDAPFFSIPDGKNELGGTAGREITGEFHLFPGADGFGTGEFLTIACASATGAPVKGVTTDGYSFVFAGIGVLTLETVSGKYTGKYTFTAETAGSYTLDFTAVDSDGDRASASVNVAVESGETSGVELTDPGAPDMQEGGLAGGSDPGAHTSHSFSLEGKIPDGYAVDTSAWQDLGSGVFTLEQGAFRLTYIPADKELRYELLAAMEHDQPLHDMELTADIVLKLRNGSGDEVDGVIKVTVVDDVPVFGSAQEISTAPDTAVSGSLGLVFGADGMAANDALVLTHDGSEYRPGTDGCTFTLEDGSTLVMLKDANGVFTGEYSFTPKNRTDYELTLTAKDGDGDMANFSLSVHTANDPAPVPDIVLEEEGVRIASVSIKQAAAITGITWDMASMPELEACADGSGTYAAVQWKVDAEEGVLYGYVADEGGGLVPVIALYAELERDDPRIRAELFLPVRHGTPDNDMAAEADILSLPFRFTAHTNQGDLSLEISVGVKDSVPVASDDALTVGGDVSEVYGNLISGEYATNGSGGGGVSGTSDRSGSDGPLVLTHVRLPGGKWVTLQEAGSDRGMPFVDLNDGNGNSIRVYADGEYTLLIGDPAGGLIAFEYAVRDNDGDTSTATLEVLAPGTGLVNLTDPAAPHLNESGLEGGTAPGEAVSHAISLGGKLPEGYRLDTSGWADDGAGVVSSLDASGYFRLAYDSGSNTLSYTLIKPFNHSDPNAPRELLDSPAQISLKLVHDSEEPRDAVIRVQVEDDAPFVGFDFSRNVEGNTGDAIDLPVEILFGGDGPASENALQIVCEAPGGTLVTGVLQADGKTYLFENVGTLVVTESASGTSYSFTAEAEGDYLLSFVVTDSDGDNDGGSLEVTVHGQPSEIVDFTDPAGPALSESGLEGGSSPGAAIGSFVNVASKMPAGYDIDLTGWVESASGSGVYSIQKDGFILTYNSADKELGFELAGPMEHDGGNNAATLAQIRLPLVNSAGGTMQGVIKVNVLDDVPSIGASRDAGGSLDSITGSIDLAYGADGMHSEAPLTVTHNGTVYELQKDGESFILGDGSVIVMEKGANGDFTGKYTFTSKASGKTDYEITFTAKDGDGDTAHTTVTVHVGVEPLTPEKTVLAESDLPVTKLVGIAQESAITELVWHVDRMPELYANDVDGVERRVEWMVDAESNDLYGLVRSASGETRHIVILYDESAGDSPAIRAELLAAIKHNGDAAGLELDLPFTAVTEYGDMAVNFTLEITDDVPHISLESGNPLETPVGGSVELPLEVAFGADGPAGEGALTIVCRAPGGGTATGALQADGKTYVFENMGTLVVEGKGAGATYSFTGNAGGEYLLTFTATDGDGDRSEAVDVAITATASQEPAGDVVLDETGGAHGFVELTQDPPVTGITWHTDALNGMEFKSLAENSGPWLPVQWKTIAAENMLIGFVLDEASGAEVEVVRVYGEFNERQFIRVELSAPLEHAVPPSGVESDTSPLSLPLSFTAHSESGGDTELSLTISVKDSVPVAHDDLVALAEGEREVHGNVINGSYRYGSGGNQRESGEEDLGSRDGANTVTRVKLLDANGEGEWIVLDKSGADGKKFADFEGDWGNLRIFEDGEYVLNLTGDIPSGLKFAYSLADADGDRSEALLEFSASSSGNTVDLTDATAPPLYESLLPGGSGYVEQGGTGTVSHAINLNGHTVNTSGWTGPAEGSGVYAREVGAFLLEYSPEQGTLSYTLLRPIEHVAGGSDQASVVFSIDLTGKDGKDYVGSVTVKIKDDAPDVSIPADARELSGTAGETIEGHFFLHYGADGADKVSPFSVTCDGKQGALQVAGDIYTYTFEGVGVLVITGAGSMSGEGSYTFTPEVSGRFELQFTAKDGDGDERHSQIVDVVVNGDTPPPPPEYPDVVDVPLHEGYPDSWFHFGANAPEDTSAIHWDTGKLPSVFGKGASSDADYSAVVWEQGENGMLLGKLADGSILITIEPVPGASGGNFRVRLEGSLQHEGGENGAGLLELPLSYTYQDTAGLVVGSTVTLKIVDDLPSIEAADTALLVKEGLATGSLAIDFGGDGQGADGYISVMCNGEEARIASDGNSAVFSDGSRITLVREGAAFTGEYVFEPAGEGMYDLRFSIRDADGSIAQSAPVLVNNPGDDKLFLGSADIDESAGFNGTAQNWAVSSDMSVNANWPEGTTGFTWNMTDLPEWEAFDPESEQWASVVWIVDDNGALHGLVNDAPCITLSPSLEWNSVQVTLWTSLRHTGADTGTVSSLLGHNFGLEVETPAGSREAVFAVSIADDAPIIDSSNWHGPLEGNVGAVTEGFLALNFGQDGQHQETPLKVYCNGVEGVMAEISDNVFAFTFEGYGTLRLELEDNYGNAPDQPSVRYYFTPTTAGMHELVFEAMDLDGDTASTHPIRISVDQSRYEMGTIYLDEAALDLGSGHMHAGERQFETDLEIPEGSDGIHSITFEKLESSSGGDVFGLNSKTGRYEPVSWECDSTEIKGWVGGELVLRVSFDLDKGVATGALYGSLKNDSPFANAYDQGNGWSWTDSMTLLLNFKVTGERGGVPMDPVDTYLSVTITDDEPEVSIGPDQYMLEGEAGQTLTGSLDLDYGADGRHESMPLEVYCSNEKGVTLDGAIFTFSNGAVVEMARDGDGAYTGEYSFRVVPQGTDEATEYALQFALRDSDGDLVASNPVYCLVYPALQGGRRFAGSLPPEGEDSEADDAVDMGMAASGQTLADLEDGYALYGNDAEGLTTSDTYGRMLNGHEGNIPFDGLESGTEGSTIFRWDAQNSDLFAGDQTEDGSPLTFDLDADKLYFEDLFASAAELQSLLASQAVDITAEEDGKLLLTVYNQEVTLDVGVGAISDQQIYNINAGDIAEKYSLLQQVLVSSVGQ